MNCDQYQTELDEFALGRLDRPTRRLMESHAAECRQCAAQTADLASLRREQATRPPPLSIDFTDRVMAQVTRSKLDRSPRLIRLFGRFGAVAAAAIAATVLGAVGLSRLANWSDSADEIVAPQPRIADRLNTTKPANVETVKATDPTPTDPALVGQYANALGRNLRDTFQAVAPAAPPPADTKALLEALSAQPEPGPDLQVLAGDGLAAVRAGFDATRDAAGPMVGFLVRQGRMFDVTK